MTRMPNFTKPVPEPGPEPQHVTTRKDKRGRFARMAVRVAGARAVEKASRATGVKWIGYTGAHGNVYRDDRGRVWSHDPVTKDVRRHAGEQPENWEHPPRR